jgi:Flp pilus assembly protein TadG
MTVEFVTIMPFFIMIVFLVIEVSLAFFWWKSAEKATQLGARVAVVSTPVSTAVPTLNALVNANVINGTRCITANSCVDFGTISCTGTGCTNATAFNRVLGRMQNILGGITAANVTISYKYVSMGFAGGPAVPLVTVTLSGVQFQTGFISILGALLGPGNALTTIPPISARITGEDLTTNGG